MQRTFKKISKTAVYLFFAALLLLAILFLGTVLPKSVGYQIRIVESGSMSPTIPTGSIVLVRPHTAYAVHDVVTFKRSTDANVVTHRIVSVSQLSGNTVYTVQGDANNTPDQKPVRQTEVIGSVWVFFPYLGYVIDFVRKPLGFAAVIGLPALWMIFEQVQKVRTQIVKTKQSDSNQTV